MVACVETAWFRSPALRPVHYGLWAKGWAVKPLAQQRSEAEAAYE